MKVNYTSQFNRLLVGASFSFDALLNAFAFLMGCVNWTWADMSKSCYCGAFRCCFERQTLMHCRMMMMMTTMRTTTILIVLKPREKWIKIVDSVSVNVELSWTLVCRFPFFLPTKKSHKNDFWLLSLFAIPIASVCLHLTRCPVRARMFSKNHYASEMRCTY